MIIICNTPFHLYLAYSFLDENNLFSDSRVIFIGLKSQKVDFYINKIKKKSNVKSIFLYENKILSIFKIFYSLLFSVKFIQGENILLGNAKLFYNRLLLINVKSSEFIYLYDDGIGSLLDKGWLDIDENKYIKIFFSIFNPSLLYSRLKEKNFYFSYLNENCFFPLSLFKNLSINTNNNCKTILIGQCYSDATSIVTTNNDYNFYKNIINNYDIDFFIPHPLSTLDYSFLRDEINVINSELIAEDILLELLKYYKLKIYSVRSTVLHNIHIMLSDFDNCIVDSFNINATLYGNLLDDNWEVDFWSENYKCIEVSMND